MAPRPRFSSSGEGRRTSAGKSEGAADGSGDDSGPRGRSCDSSGVPGEGTTATRHLSLHPPASPPRSRPRLHGRQAGRDPQKTIKSHGGGEAVLPTASPSRTCPSCCSSLPTGIPQQPWLGLQQLPAWSLPSPWGAFVPPRGSRQRFLLPSGPFRWVMWRGRHPGL